MSSQSFSEQLWNGIGDAIADIREKAVEEPWFGRVVTERGDAMEWPQAQEPEPMQMQPEGMTGDILPPEHAAHEPGGWPALEQGTVLEGQAEPVQDSPRLDWPQAQDMEPQREQAQDIDLDR